MKYFILCIFIFFNGFSTCPLNNTVNHARWFCGNDKKILSLSLDECSKNVEMIADDIRVINKFVTEEKNPGVNLLSHKGTLYVNNAFPITRVMEVYDGKPCLQLCHILGLPPQEIEMLKKLGDLKSRIVRYRNSHKEIDKKGVKEIDYKILLFGLCNELNIEQKNSSVDLENELSGKLKNLDENFSLYVEKINRYLKKFGPCNSVNSYSSYCCINFDYKYVHTEYLLFNDPRNKQLLTNGSKIAFVSSLHMCENCENMVVKESVNINSVHDNDFFGNPKPKIIVVSFLTWNTDQLSEERNNNKSSVLKIKAIPQITK